MTKDQKRLTRPCVELVANRIDDPVARLRFLRWAAPATKTPGRARLIVRLSPLLLGVALSSFFLLRALGRGEPARPRPASTPAAPGRIAPEVWLVETAGDSESYSNGLRIDARFATRNHPRGYLAYPAGARGMDGVGRTDPAGIVFHTTESRLEPFEEARNKTLKRIGESLLDYVQRKRAYHFLIDRFGRVYRIVEEQDAANHAGYSVWADDQWLYINLNESFLGVSFETGTAPGQVEAAITPAQERAAAMLTEMLRGRHHIAAANCVTHAQVSVNPSNMRIGYHTDWASSFPFERLGLPDNYSRPLPSLSLFGYQYDAPFLRQAGPKLYQGVEMGERRLEQAAERAGLDPKVLRRQLERAYRERLAETRRRAGEAEAAD